MADEILRENQRLRDEVKMLRNILREKDDELSYLEAYILERGRLRFLVKELIIKMDSIITVHLTKWTRNRKHYPPIYTDETETDPAVILQAVQAADKAAFLARPSFLHQIEASSFKAVYAVYRVVKRALYRSLRVIIRKLTRR